MEGPRIPTSDELAWACVGIVLSITIRNGEEWKPSDQIALMIERDRAAVRRECADRAEAWYTQGVPESSRDEYAVEIVQLRAAIEGKEVQG